MTNLRWTVPLISLALLALVGLWRHQTADAARAAVPDEEYALFVG